MSTPQLNLFNALTREKQVFTPLHPTNIRMYVCGITPYDYAHIGNLRTMVVFDVLFRLLSYTQRQRTLATGQLHKVTYVRNYTDIDDKIVARAVERNVEPFALAAEFIEIFEADMARLNMLKPTEQPRVSQHMPGIARMVDDLIAKGFAYVTESGDVMFSVPAFETLPNPPHNTFGHLARRTFDKLQARVEEDAEKRDPRDFPVWKANAKSSTKMEQAFVPSELGATQFKAPGRPGWHIECSVMSEAILGPDYKAGDPALFDIHGGGEDLAFPHHSCEIAQTEALHPTCTMCSIWMHNAFLTVGGTKMSKSLDNFVTVKDTLHKYKASAVRFWLLQTHYRKAVDYTDEALQGAQATTRLYSWLALLSGYTRVDEEVTLEIKEYSDYLFSDFLDALNDDLNTPKAFAKLFELISYGNHRFGVKKNTSDFRYILKIFKEMTDILGFEPSEELAMEATSSDAEKAEIESLKARYIAARSQKNWEESDSLRDKLRIYGLIPQDGPSGTSWRSPTILDQ